MAWKLGRVGVVRRGGERRAGEGNEGREGRQVSIFNSINAFLFVGQKIEVVWVSLKLGELNNKS